MTSTQLTPAQHAILAYALEHSSGKIDWFPDNIKGGARKKVLDGLFNRAFITTNGTDWFVAAEGYVLAVRILTDKSSYNTVEDLGGRMVSLRSGDILAGTLGVRRALRGYRLLRDRNDGSRRAARGSCRAIYCVWAWPGSR